MGTGEPQPTKAPQRQRIVALTKSGMKPREIAGALNLTTQRIHQALARARELGELSKEEA
jgi:DNA-directed RNA polymerase specialized sigma24 family protein